MFGFGKTAYGVRNLSRVQRKALRRNARLVSRDTKRFSFGGSTYDYAVPYLVAGQPLVNLHGFEDESGDLGKKRGSSDRLVSALVVTEYPEYLDYVIGRYPANSRGYPNSSNEIKFSNSTDEVRIGVLTDSMLCNPRIYAAVSDKRVDGPYRSGAPLLHDTLAEAVLLASEHEDGFIDVTFDQHRSLESTDAARICTMATLGGNAVVLCRDHAGVSARSPGLQMADMYAGTIARRYNRGFPSVLRKRYWNVIKRNTRIRER